MKTNVSIPILTIFLLLLFLFPHVFYGQVTENFETGALNGWYSEGDGNYSISSDIANPGFSFKIADDASGILNYAIAPSIFLGDWSLSNSNDSLTVDIYVQSSDPDLLVGEFPVFEIVGQGGRATILNGQELERNTWHTLTVSLNQNDWTLESGTWEGLIGNISLFKIRAEYIIGLENVYLDNIHMSFSPTQLVIVETICSDFESETFDGWHFEENGTISISSLNGNPGFSIEINDASSAVSQAISPPKFLGDWTAFENIGTIKFDLLINTNLSNSLYGKEYLIKISGMNSSAQIGLDETQQNAAINQWHTYEFEINQNIWDITSGDWNSIISNVEEIRLELEFITGNETAYLDNFCITPNLTTNTLSNNSLANIELYPNPSKGTIFITGEENIFIKAELFNYLGQRIDGNIMLERNFVKIETTYKGLLFVMLNTKKGNIVKKVVVN